jgi:hypothetical protein
MPLVHANSVAGSKAPASMYVEACRILSFDQTICCDFGRLFHPPSGSYCKRSAGWLRAALNLPWRMTMRFRIAFVGALGVCLLSGASGARAQDGINQPWCGVTGGTEECVYRTLEQCEYDMRPISGDCSPNPRVAGSAVSPRAAQAERHTGHAEHERPVTTGTADQTPGINEPWCGRTAGTDECVFSTQAQCEYEMRPLSGICFPNPDRR